MLGVPLAHPYKTWGPRRKGPFGVLATYSASTSWRESMRCAPRTHRTATPPLCWETYRAKLDAAALDRRGTPRLEGEMRRSMRGEDIGSAEHGVVLYANSAASHSTTASQPARAGTAELRRDRGGAQRGAAADEDRGTVAWGNGAANRAAGDGLVVTATDRRAWLRSWLLHQSPAASRSAASLAQVWD
jgi:hypothetical protein